MTDFQESRRPVRAVRRRAVRSGAGGFPAGRGGLGTGPAKRRSHNLLGWAVQWATAQMLGTFLSAPADVPQGVAALVAEQLETGARHEGL
ncbi:DUF4158 domain-containing protein [Streptomyces sp. NBC_01373]|uniref:DUF4158 domain-containing protein n=1 Tax=Streptomyces sp. NBC_01373 TaxID=2903843 RepID=UPI00224D966B|nr:DUF4158 domain-containing protein [Streptomyces sp. NBC_01373]MCX4697361.1 DUF4158 domain-containing protein [Streptomyces sp. NBC_01373]